MVVSFTIMGNTEKGFGWKRVERGAHFEDVKLKLPSNQWDISFWSPWNGSMMKI